MIGCAAFGGVLYYLGECANSAIWSKHVTTEQPVKPAKGKKIRTD
jgi:hypothetical protein